MWGFKRGVGHLENYTWRVGRLREGGVFMGVLREGYGILDPAHHSFSVPTKWEGRVRARSTCSFGLGMVLPSL